ncbi:hypothetical protein [Tateyamaria sp.]
MNKSSKRTHQKCAKVLRKWYWLTQLAIVPVRGKRFDITEDW